MFVTLLPCLFFWFIISKLLLHFSIGPFFPSHLFTSTASFLSCKCLHNPSSAASSTFPNLQHPLHAGHGCCVLRVTAPAVAPLCCSPPAHLGIWTLFLLVAELSVLWASPRLLHRALQHQLKGLVCLGVLPGILFSFLLPSSRSVDDLSFSVSADSLSVLLIFGHISVCF